MTDGDANRLRAVALAAVTVLAVLALSMGTAGGAASTATAGGTTSVAATGVNSCTTIDANGTYELTGDINATNTGSCLLVTASNVTIDGNGYTIDGYDDNTFYDDGDPEYINGSVGVHVQGTHDDVVENVTVRNVTMQDGNVGFRASHGHDVTLEDVTVNHTDKEAVTTYRTNGTVTLRNVTVTESAKYATRNYDEGTIHYDPAVDIGNLGSAAPDDDYVDEVVISNLTARDNRHRDMLDDDSTVNVYAGGPVTITDSVVERSESGGISVSTPPWDYGDLDVSITNVTVREFGLLAEEENVSLAGLSGIYVNAEDGATVRNATVINGSNKGAGFDVSGGQDVVFTNNTVRNVQVDYDEDAAVKLSSDSGYSTTTVRDVRIASTGNGSGLTAYGSDGITVRDVTVNGTADASGWGANVRSDGDSVVRNVTVEDSGDGGLLIDAAEDLDARNLSVNDVRFQTEGIDDPFEDGEGLVVRGGYGTVENVTVSSTAGGVRVEETGEGVTDRELAVGNLTVVDTDHSGVGVRGDSVALVDVAVENASKAGVVKRPEESSASDADEFGEFLARNVSINDTRASGFVARLDGETDHGTGPNDHVNLTNVDVTNADGDGVRMTVARTAAFHGVDVASAAGVDLNLTHVSATLDRVQLSGTRVDGDARNVTVDAVNASQASPVPSERYDVGVFLEANDTSRDGYLNATVHYDDADVPAGLDESTLQLWRDDGSRWSAVGGESDPAANTVSKNVTYFSTFAPLGSDGTRSTAANFSVDVTGVDDPVWTDTTLTVTVEVTNQRASQETQTVELLDFDGNVVDTESVTLGGGNATTVTLDWTLSSATADTRDVAVRSEHGWDTASVEMSPVSGETILDCAVISEPGSYELARDLSYSSDQACVEIQSGDVHVDGQGHGITGPSGANSDDRGDAVVVDVQNGPAENVTVRNLTVEDVTTVAELTAETETLSDVTLRNVSAPSVASGVHATGTFDGLSIRDSDVTVTGDERGEGIAVEVGGSDATTRNVSVSNVTIRNEAGATTRGIEVELDGERVTLDGLDVSNATIHTADEPVAVVGPSSNSIERDSVVRNLTVSESDLNSTTDSAVLVKYASTDAVLESVRIEDSELRTEDAADHGIALEGNDDGTKTRDVVVTGNDIGSVDDGVYANLENGYEEVHGLEVSNNSISADGHGVYVDATDGANTPSIRDLAVRNNTVTGGSTGIQVWVSGTDATADGVSIVDNHVSGAGLGLDLLFAPSGSARYDATVSGNDVTGFTTTGVLLEAQADPGANLELAENEISNETGAVTGLAVQTASDDATGNGTLAITRNTVRTGGDAVVVNEDTPGGGPVDSIEIAYNVLDAPGFGVENHNAAGDGQGRAWVNATKNYWNASDGPESAGGLTDPVTGATADGSGSNVSTGASGEANVHFDPHATSPNPQALFVSVDSTTSPVTEGETLSVTATVENGGDESETQTVALSVGGTEVDSRSVTLAGGASTTVTLDWSTAVGDAGSYTATVATANDTDSTPVTVDPLSDGNLSVSVDSTTSPVTEGETLSVTATVENVGGKTVTGAVNLSTDGVKRDEATVTLDGGASTTVTLDWATAADDAGSYTATVATANDTDSAGVTVDDAPSPANLSVSVDSTNAPVTEGQTLTVDATVENVGDLEGTRTVNLSVGGVERDETAVTLGPGNTTSVTLTWSTATGDVGSYTATVATANDTDSAGASVEADGEPVASCTVIDAPGRYVVTGSILNASTDSCIEITASDVVLDGYGHTVNGDDRAYGSAGVRVSGSEQLSNVTVRNVVLVEWGAGVVFGDEYGASVENATASGVTADQSDTGVFLANASGVTVRDSVVRYNDVGVEVGSGAADSVVRNNTVEGSGENGVWLAGTNNTVRNNTLRENTAGIYVPYWGVSDFAVTGNLVRNSTNAGMDVRATGGTFENNTLRGDDVGVLLLGASDNRFRNTTITGTANGSVVATPQMGEVPRVAANNTFTDADLGYAGATLSFTLRNAVVQSVSVASAPALPANTTDVDVYLATDNTSTASYIDLTVAYDDAAVSDIDESTLSTWRHDDGNWTDLGGTVDAAANTVSKNVTEFGVLAPLSDTTGAAGSPPTAKFTHSPSTVYVGEDVTFDASTTTDPDADVVSYAWDVDGDGSYEQSGASVTLTHAYGSAGDRTVTLRVTDDEGNTDTAAVTLTVHEGGPAANLTYSPTPVYVNESVTFDASGSLDPTDDIVTYEWDVDGDGSYERNVTSATLAHSYASAGERTVTLRVTDEHGHTGTVTRTVTAEAGEPTANFTSTPTTYVGEEVTFDAAATTDPTADVVTYEWDVDDDGNYEESGASATLAHTYASAGERTVTLRVTDDDGNTDTAERTVTVLTGGPTANFTYSPLRPGVGESVTLNASTTTDPTDDVASYEWDTDGDGDYEQSHASATATVSYATPGERTVTLRVTDDDGTSDTVERVVTVVDRTPPTVDLTAVDANASAATPPTGQTVHTNGTVSFEVAANGTPGDATDVNVSLLAWFANFEHAMAASHQGGETWTVTADLSTLPDDGRYGVNVSAVDPAGNENRTPSDVTVRLDRDAPDLGATVSRLDADTGSVNVTASEALDGQPTIEVAKPDGTTETATVVDSGETYWNATFGVTGGGQYNVTVTGRDRAGNLGTGTASTYVDTVDTENNTATVVLEPSGLFVNFTTDAEVTDTVVVTESDTPLAPLAAGDAGVSFLNAQLGEYLVGNLSHAVVGIPVDTSAVPASVEKDDVQIRYYNETESAWDRKNTSVEQRTINGTTREYWVANVSHFSTYGAVASDGTEPTITGVTPADGYEYASGTASPTLRVDYADAVSGVNASAVTVEFDGVDVTDSSGTQVTSSYVEYTPSGLTNGSTHALSVTVEDDAGNRNSTSSSLSIATPPAFSVANAQLDATSVEPGDSVTITADVTNTGGEEGAYTATLAQNGSQVAQTTVTVPSGATETVTFTRSYASEGTYVLGVSGTTASTLTVESSDDSSSTAPSTDPSDSDETTETTTTRTTTPTTTQTPTTTTSTRTTTTSTTTRTTRPATSTATTESTTSTATDGQPGFGAGVALVALLAAALVARRRQ